MENIIKEANEMLERENVRKQQKTKQNENEQHKEWYRNKYANDEKFREEVKEKRKIYYQNNKMGVCETRDGCEYKTKVRCKLCNRRACHECSDIIEIPIRGREPNLIIVCSYCERTFMRV